MMFAISINDEQGKLISYFASAGFLLRAEQLDAYCNSRGQRKSFLIESINDTCFELLDDNLIEELDEETYEMNKDYYKTTISA
ncbi:tellurite resistance TerB C-terminal domain-containing protein [Sphingobacterium sp. SGL-16]|uniref:tellurite resistance TerB C-terminal domain-containing protein n=1 Tax=Sphingobacterium sp. SGL-16 TaxID=2710883 RepID=UPI0013EA8727|nr:tellurite resistance TerB C-terminal domain-containing protein [Sphingobacterium sp. SGL-16]NGM71691.1 hypothetical protein [Sphingobacterium sp. SGL-16]